MKVTIKRPVEVDIATVKMVLPVRYGEEDIPNDYPGRVGDVLTMIIDIDTGTVKNWPRGRIANFYMKVVDEGVYALFDRDGKEVACLDQEYVPNHIIPGEYGDYVKLVIDETGKIMNWKEPSFEDFFGEDAE